jgi:hypothetical protein
VGNFGSWSGVDADFGTCTYAPNSNWAIANCGADHEFTETWTDDEEHFTDCNLILIPVTGGSSGESSDPGGCMTEVRGPLEQPVTLYLCHHKPGSATFPTGACALKCTISADLPGPADRKLPGNEVAVFYVRVVNPGGEPGTDRYTVCFYVKDLGLEPPSIYRFSGGEWVLVAYGTSNSSYVCASAAGDGAFYLGEPKKDKKGE